MHRGTHTQSKTHLEVTLAASHLKRLLFFALPTLLTDRWWRAGSMLHSAEEAI